MAIKGKYPEQVITVVPAETKAKIREISLALDTSDSAVVRDLVREALIARAATDPRYAGHGLEASEHGLGA